MRYMQITISMQMAEQYANGWSIDMQKWQDQMCTWLLSNPHRRNIRNKHWHTVNFPLQTDDKDDELKLVTVSELRLYEKMMKLSTQR